MLGMYTSWTPAITGFSTPAFEVRRLFQRHDASAAAVCGLRLAPVSRFRRRFPDRRQTHPVARARSWKMSRSKLDASIYGAASAFLMSEARVSAPVQGSFFR